MKKIGIIFSFIFILLGVFIIAISNLFKELVPMLGLAAFQAAAAGSYSPQNYEIDLGSNYWLGTWCVIFGILGVLVVSSKDFIILYIKNLRDEFKKQKLLKDFEDMNHRQD
ncbi:hypothetical protein KZ483_02555 [Paenibacillus sp. sptzw28]|uniref:hypothetical protein n=1 Tax=Paenibacillus sp. sptzw28 TaxID=715179 RepID=UPI001C6E145D|nr:hypothetical protein [Paenibacillus sp. sptzw28]QYR21937.1 hypothetical protein KZ483_02555 [Paenibacillus sp. sptzw28]